jgi:beta-lactamase regulating signal transducer with metallopeptidase domain
MMPEGLWLILIFIALVIIYTIAKVFEYMKKSDQQWQQVDKSKLREWNEDDDWSD